MKNRFVKYSALLGSASALALSISSPVMAQDADAPAAEDDSRRLNTVEVTATRREGATIQDVPIAVTALDPETLDRAGVADIRNLDSVAPSFNMNTSDTESGGITLRLRGVGTTGNNIGLESSVGVFLDGVYLSRPGIALADLLDLQQVEVLRGPQGTLFGRNTSAGALNITTKKPDLEEAGGFGNLTLGNYDLFNLQGGFNLPITDKLAVRFSGALRQRDGFLTDFNGDDTSTRDRITARAQALYDMGEGGEIRVIIDYAEGEDECCDAVWFSNGAPDAAFQALGLADGAAPSVQPNLDDYTSNSANFLNPFEQTGYSLSYENDIGFADFTYIGSYRDYFANSFRNTDYTGLNIFTVGASPEAQALPGTAFDPLGGTDIFTTTHEARLQGLAFDDRLDWLVGLYYSDEDIESRGSLSLLDEFQAGVSAGFGLPANLLLVDAQFADAAGDFATNEFEQNGQSMSIFTHNVFSVNDKLDLTVGLRYVDESKDGRFTQLGGNHDACIGQLTNPASILGTTGVALNCFVFAAPTLDRLQVINPGAAANPLAGVFLGREFDLTFEDDELVYTLKAGYKVNDDINVYGGFTHGFKSGGFNLDASAGASGADPRFASEKIDAFEAGLKATILDGAGVFNAAVFHQEMEDFQVLEFTGIRFQTFNVAKAQSTGFEVETQAQLTDNFAGSLGVTYTDANYPDDCATFDPTSAGFNINAATLCGNPLTNAPDWVTIIGGNYERMIADGNANLFVTGSIRHETERRTSTQAISVPGAAALAGATDTAAVRALVASQSALPGDFQDANTKVNLRVGIEAPDERWAVELWGNNITDERTKNVTFNIPLRANSRGQFVQDPATYGVTLRTKF